MNPTIIHPSFSAVTAAAQSADTGILGASWLLPVVVLLGFALTLTLLAFILFSLARGQNKYRHNSDPQVQETLLEAEQHANHIVSEATEEARSLRAATERERLRALEEDHHDTDRFLEAYTSRLDRTISELSYGIEKEHTRATSHFVDSLQKIEKRVADDADEATHSIESFTSQSSVLFERLSAEIENVEKGIQHLAVALEEAAVDESGKNVQVVREEMQKIGSQVAQSVLAVAKDMDRVMQEKLDHEFRSISEEIEKYRAGRLKLVDERILVLVEETVQIALQKKLSMAEQSELVYRALEEAKQRGIFV